MHAKRSNVRGLVHKLVGFPWPRNHPIMIMGQEFHEFHDFCALNFSGFCLSFLSLRRIPHTKGIFSPETILTILWVEITIV